MTQLELNAIVESSVAVPPGRRSRRRGGVRVLGIALGVITVAVALGPWLPFDPHTQVLDNALQPPAWLNGGEWSHPLGTDKLGRDILARLLEGGRLSLLLAVGGVLGGLIPGVAMGLVAGYRGGRADGIVSRLAEAQLALPAVLVAIAIISSTGRSITVLLVVLSLLSWAQYARIVRADALAVRERPFVTALRCAGVSELRIALRHVLPNVAGNIVVIATLEVGAMILAESGLSFLGLGVVSPDVSWGAMLAEGRDQLRLAWWVAIFPGLAITLVVLLVNLLGDALVESRDPRRGTS